MKGSAMETHEEIAQEVWAYGDNDAVWDAVFAEDRRTDEACEKGTVGCSVRHASKGPETECEPW